MERDSMRVKTACSFVVATFAAVAFAAPLAAHDPSQHHAGAHHHPEAAKLKNPVTPNEESIAAGHQLYIKRCAECHGDTGKGDGDMADMSDPKPANLSDADWKHGSTDGEIFTVIRDGVKGTDMKPFSKKLTTHQMWDAVNYIRSIGPSPSH
jgi:mono/diheme cytochrome c family protein